MNADGTVTQLHPTRFLETSSSGPDQDHIALIVLNSPLCSYEHFKLLHDHAAYMVCADGGANRLHDLILGHFPDANVMDALGSAKPDSIHGDLDSLKDHVCQRYKALGVEVSHDSDQYSTDFGKAVIKIVQQAPETRDVIVLGSIGGRVDQGVGLLHEIYREQNFRHSAFRFWLFSESSISVLLQPGTSVINTPLDSGLITPNVGILPLYGKAVLTLEGFEWDVETWPSEMGAQLSTSNHIMTDNVRVTTDVTVLFTIEKHG